MYTWKKNTLNKKPPFFYSSLIFFLTFLSLLAALSEDSISSSSGIAPMPAAPTRDDRFMRDIRRDTDMRDPARPPIAVAAPGLDKEEDWRIAAATVVRPPAAVYVRY